MSRQTAVDTRIRVNTYMYMCMVSSTCCSWDMLCMQVRAGATHNTTFQLNESGGLVELLYAWVHQLHTTQMAVREYFSPP